MPAQSPTSINTKHPTKSIPDEEGIENLDVEESLGISVIYGRNSIEARRKSDVEMVTSVSFYELIVPDGTAHVSAGAFASSMPLLSAVLPESLISIASKAFGGCENLESIIVFLAL